MRLLADQREARLDDALPGGSVEVASTGEGPPHRAGEGLGAREGRAWASDVLQDAQSATPPKHAAGLAQGGLRIADRAEDQGEDHPVEGVIGEWEGLGRSHDQPGARRASGGPPEHRDVGVDRRDQGARRVVGQLAACAHADFKDLSIEPARQIAPEPGEPQAVQEPDEPVVQPRRDVVSRVRTFVGQYASGSSLSASLKRLTML